MKRYIKCTSEETYICDTSDDHSLNNSTLYKFVRNIGDKLEIGDTITIHAYNVPYIAPGGGGDPTGHDLNKELLITKKNTYGNSFTTVSRYDNESAIRKKLQNQEFENWREITDGALFLVMMPEYTITVERGKYADLI